MASIANALKGILSTGFKSGTPGVNKGASGAPTSSADKPSYKQVRQSRMDTGDESLDTTGRAQ